MPQSKRPPVEIDRKTPAENPQKNQAPIQNSDETDLTLGLALSASAAEYAHTQSVATTGVLVQPKMVIIPDTEKQTIFKSFSLAYHHFLKALQPIYEAQEKSQQTFLKQEKSKMESEKQTIKKAIIKQLVELKKHLAANYPTLDFPYKNLDLKTKIAELRCFLVKPKEIEELNRLDELEDNKRALYSSCLLYDEVQREAQSLGANELKTIKELLALIAQNPITAFDAVYEHFKQQKTQYARKSKLCMLEPTRKVHRNIGKTLQELIKFEHDHAAIFGMTVLSPDELKKAFTHMRELRNRRFNRVGSATTETTTTTTVTPSNSSANKTLF